MEERKRQPIELLQESFKSFIGLMQEKYRPWTYEAPLFMDGSRIGFLKKSQAIMLKLMRHVTANYNVLEEHLSHSEAVTTFLKQLQDIPFQEGTFRTDFVVNNEDEIRLIEVTCRYPLNAYFRSVGMNTLNRAHHYEKVYGLKATSYAEPLQQKFLDWMGDADRFIIIQGHDLRANESNFLPSFIRDANINIQMCSYEDWLEHGAAWLKGAAIMAELTFEEWLNLPISLVRAMLERPLLNDPRLVLTVHDKGFFGLVNIEEITNEALSAEETAFIQKAFAETYFLDRQPELLDKAKTKPEDWMLKPRKLGRSVNIIAGSLSSKAEWEEALDLAAENDNMILQKWHLSKKIRGTVQGVDHEDYFAGTLLYWGSDFFGPGFFRASCYPISNVKDNRMVTYFIDLKADSKDYPDLQWV
ncbi:hypothetical protein [Flagellimonas marinaquae]